MDPVTYYIEKHYAVEIICVWYRLSSNGRSNEGKYVSLKTKVKKVHHMYIVTLSVIHNVQSNQNEVENHMKLVITVILERDWRGVEFDDINPHKPNPADNGIHQFAPTHLYFLVLYPFTTVI